MKTERTKNSTYNILVNVFVLFLKTVLSFVVRTIFINTLGKELLGLDGLFINILSMLSLAELGISSAINFSLYEPLQKKDIQKISALLSLYKRIYTGIGISILLLGLMITPFLKSLINGYTFDNLYLIYFLYLIDCSSSYFITYKETIIIADQKVYKLGIFDTIFSILLYGSQVLVLLISKNFILYLLLSIFIKFLHKISKNIYISKKYNYVDFSSKQKIDEKTKSNIVSNTKALIFHNIGDYLLNGTDNIIISTINIGLVGIYSNYLSIIGIMRTLVNCICNGVIASFGNVIITESKETQENIFNISNFMCMVVCGLISSEIIVVANHFISFWIGADYLLSFWIVVILGINFYFYSLLVSLDVVKKAAGIYNKDKFVPLLQATVNLTFSIILGKLIGIGGVILGTFLSYITVGMLLKPKIVYKNIFMKKATNYYKKQIIQICVMTFSVIFSILIIDILNFEISLLLIIIECLIVFIIYILSIILVYKKTSEFNYFINVLKKKNKEV